MSDRTETVEDIIREMRKKADQADFACCGNVDATFVRIFADRIEKVYDHERRSWDAAIVDQRAINRKLVDEMAAKDSEIAKLTADNKRMESLQQKAGETVVGLMNKASAQSAEIAKLRAALKPVLKLEDNYGGHWPFASLAVDAVKEAQRIYKEVAK